jgi:chorismate mutase
MNTNIQTESLLNSADAGPLIIAGPCSAETEQQMLSTAKSIAEINPQIIFRAGIWKPRTRPNAFEGVGSIGLQWLSKVKTETGLRTSTEVANATHAEECLRAGVDILWIGARTTVNPFSVQEIAEALRGTNISVLVKNPVTPDIQLWIGALERLNKCGLKKLAAVHRGFHSRNITPFRNDPMWPIAVELKTSCPDLPMICDPSHICGSTELIPYIAQKALDLDMQGLMIETHCIPSLAWSDAKQQLAPNQLEQLLSGLSYRKAEVVTAAAGDELEELRTHINKADEEILQLLMNRMKISESIGQFKKSNSVTVLQTRRWEQLLHNRIQTAGMMGLNEEFVRSLYLLIHDESIRKQAEIMNDKIEVNVF